MFQDEKPLLLSLREVPPVPQHPQPLMATERSPGAAFLLSLVAPGLGQMYCGKVKRGLWTLGFFVVSAVVVVWLFSSNDDRMMTFWGTALRAALGLYAFAFLDAYFTAREIRSGSDRVIVYNPRVAAVLNLLTRGWGYWYADEKARGVILFVLVGAASRAHLKLELGRWEAWLGLFVEVALAVMAVDGYRIAVRNNAARTEKLPDASSVQPSSGLHPWVPVTLAGVIALLYATTAVTVVLAPEYDKIDQTQALKTKTEQELRYENPRYGVGLRAPGEWEFSETDKGDFVQIERMFGACTVILSGAPDIPFLGLETIANLNVKQFRAELPKARVTRRARTELDGLPALETTIAGENEDEEYEMTLVLAKKRFSLYVLVTIRAGWGMEACAEDLKQIRQQVKLP